MAICPSADKAWQAMQSRLIAPDRCSIVVCILLARRKCWSGAEGKRHHWTSPPDECQVSQLAGCGPAGALAAGVLLVSTSITPPCALAELLPPPAALPPIPTEFPDLGDLRLPSIEKVPLPCTSMRHRPSCLHAALSCHLGLYKGRPCMRLSHLQDAPGNEEEPYMQQQGLAHAAVLCVHSANAVCRTQAESCGCLPAQLTLSNGLRVYLLEDHDVPLVKASLLFRGGMRTSPPDKVSRAPRPLTPQNELQALPNRQRCLFKPAVTSKCMQE